MNGAGPVAKKSTELSKAERAARVAYHEEQYRVCPCARHADILAMVLARSGGR